MSSCSLTLHPTITITPQNGGRSFAITGSGFSSGSPCATLSYDPPSGITTIVKDVPCAKGNFNPNVAWTPAQIPDCTANTPVTVLAVDHRTGNPGSASTSLLCEVALCPAELRVKTVTAMGKETNELTNASMPPYFAKGYSKSLNWIKTPGETGLSELLSSSTCVPKFILFIFELTSRSQAGGFEECTYEAKKSTSSSCDSVVTNDKMLLVFECPDSGACR